VPVLTMTYVIAQVYVERPASIYIIHIYYIPWSVYGNRVIRYLDMSEALRDGRNIATVVVAITSTIHCPIIK
jgi:hypothetical protein